MGFRKPPELPSNFTFHSMEEKESVAWSANMRRFFSGIEDEHFIFLFDDYFLLREVDKREVEGAERFLIEEGIAKFDLSRCTKAYPHSSYKGMAGKYQANYDAFLRLNTQAAIWTRDFWLKWMNEGLNPWQFEIHQNCKGDEVIVGGDKQIIQYSNICNKGLIRQAQVDLIPIEDRKKFFVFLEGRFGSGKCSNVPKEFLKEGIRLKKEFLKEGAFVVSSIVITKIIFNEDKVTIEYNCLNNDGIMIRQDSKRVSKDEFLLIMNGCLKVGLDNIYKKKSELVAKYCGWTVKGIREIRFTFEGEDKKIKSLNVRGDDYLKLVDEGVEQALEVLSNHIFTCG